MACIKASSWLSVVAVAAVPLAVVALVEDEAVVTDDAVVEPVPPLGGGPGGGGGMLPVEVPPPVPAVTPMVPMALSKAARMAEAEVAVVPSLAVDVALAVPVAPVSEDKRLEVVVLSLLVPDAAPGGGPPGGGPPGGGLVGPVVALVLVPPSVPLLVVPLDTADNWARKASMAD
ncbi:hypothetical protein P7D22_22040 [Lichenihabitans sp. Uapishka_5]|uniref:hypothetical protein n=1 Tax=Lichenihabitans sp. Uapishka_5 TaxID=3037302 RepID=UPI0029E810FA|nr:hypothetical protein [Lichenihabitans sp. Uapishka_5]MDX7953842.1 hypothetical protein [Lichenihabitans sp. Uapishka_5]